MSFFADDLGGSDTTLYGTTEYYQTPNIERLAKRGMTFTRAYSASPLCSPTRSALLTVLSPARTGITTPNCHLPQVVLEATAGKKAPPDQKAIMPDPPTRLKPEYCTLAETLKDASYTTGHFGKWHLGSEPYSPLEQGFDVDLPHHPGPGPAGSFVAPWKFAKFKERAPGEHIEDRMADEAVAGWKKQGPPVQSQLLDNFAAQRRELVSELDALIEKFLADSKAVVPVPNSAFTPAAYQPENEGQPSAAVPKGVRSRKNRRRPTATGICGSGRHPRWSTSKSAATTHSAGGMNTAAAS